MANEDVVDPAGKERSVRTGLLRSRPSAEQLVGPLEYGCLSVVWRRGSASVGQVRADLNSRRGDRDELAYTTVMTVLARLHEKGILHRVKVGRGYVYRPAVSEEELVERMGRREIEQLLSRYGDVAVAQFASAMRELSPQHLAELRRLIESGAGDDH
jgi:predicted transcriptional regulator